MALDGVNGKFINLLDNGLYEVKVGSSPAATFYNEADALLFEKNKINGMQNVSRYVTQNNQGIFEARVGQNPTRAFYNVSDAENFSRFMQMSNIQDQANGIQSKINALQDKLNKGRATMSKAEVQKIERQIVEHQRRLTGLRGDYAVLQHATGNPKPLTTTAAATPHTPVPNAGQVVATSTGTAGAASATGTGAAAGSTASNATANAVGATASAGTTAANATGAATNATPKPKVPKSKGLRLATRGKVLWRKMPKYGKIGVIAAGVATLFGVGISVLNKRPNLDQIT